MIGRDISIAADLLRNGKVVGIPTETVYGLAANALDEAAVLSIFKIKKRPFFDPLIVHTHHFDAISKFIVDIPDIAVKLANAFWPGPMTLLLPKTNEIPDIVTSGSDLVAIRIPNHPIALELLRSVDFPLAAPSANPFGYISPTRAEHVENQLKDQVEYILDGGVCQIGLESTIINCASPLPKVLRLGGLSLKHIEDCLGYSIPLSISAGSNPLSAGQLDKHYAPSTDFLLTTSLLDEVSKHKGKRVALLTFGELIVPADYFTLNLSPDASLDEAAKNLFHYMRILDQHQFDLIIASKVPDVELGMAINDRLHRASTK